MARPVPAVVEGEQLPHPAEDLSADDDLLSWILVDQLGCLPNTKLGVHPQQVKFVGPPFKTSEILSIVHETVVNTNIPEAMRRFLDFHLIKAHCDAKQTLKQKERFIQHLKRYLLPLLPTSRIEIFTTSRYSNITGHTELAVYATRPLPIGAVLQELQGSVVPLPDAWRAEMDLGDEFAFDAAGEEDELEGEDGEEGDDADDDDSKSRTRDVRTESVVDEANDTPSKRNRRRKEARGARRSDRTKRRDFSIVWSGLKRCYQLFLGPARFLNHDCNPNVELLRQGKYVTFRAVRPIRIGDEVMTFYGENYFGKNNIECLCLSCEQACRGGFTPKEPLSEIVSRGRSASLGSSAQAGSPSSRRQAGPSALRNALSGLDLEMADDVDRMPIAGPSGTSHEDVSEPVTPRKLGHRPSQLSVSVSGIGSPATESVRSEPESPSEDNPPKRERYHRRAARNAQHFSFLKRPRKDVVVDPRDELQMDEEDEDCVRCATCAKALHERIWYNNKYFDHCARCVRHALIFDLPWPAHRPSDVLDFPPPHLIPAGYIPPRVSSIALPSLDKHRKKHVEPVPVSPQGETGMERKAWKVRQRHAMDDLLIEQLHEAAWTAQETRENQIQAAEQARLDAKAAREEAKKKKYANRERGSGVWARYEYIDEEELERKRLAKMALTTGTRRGGRFKPEEQDIPKDNKQKEREREEHEKEQAEVEKEETSVAGPSRAHDSSGVSGGSPWRTPRVPSRESLPHVTMEEHQQSPPTRLAREQTPEKTQIKPEPSVTPSKRLNEDVIFLSDSQHADSDSDGVEAIDDPTEEMIADATRVAVQRRARNNEPGYMVSPRKVTSSSIIRKTEFPTNIDPDSDSDCREVVGEETTPRRQVSTAHARKAFSATRVSLVDESRPTESDRDIASRRSSTATGSPSPTKRGRGRPKGSGKNQKAAAMHAARIQGYRRRSNSTDHVDSESEQDTVKRKLRSRKRLGRASDSNAVTNTTNGASTSFSGDTHFLDGVEKMLSALDGASSPTYEWMIESLDDEGTLRFKDIGQAGSSPFPPEEIVRKFVDKEHGEFLRLLKPQPRPSPASLLTTVHDPLGLPNGKPRSLPGESCLVNRAEIKKWNPSRMKTPRPDKASTRYLNSALPFERGVSIVGYTLDTYAYTSEKPSLHTGPWRHDLWRMIGARPKDREGDSDTAHAQAELQEGDIVFTTNGNRSEKVKKVDKGKGKAIAAEDETTPPLARPAADPQQRIHDPKTARRPSGAAGSSIPMPRQPIPSGSPTRLPEGPSVAAARQSDPKVDEPRSHHTNGKNRVGKDEAIGPVMKSASPKKVPHANSKSKSDLKSVSRSPIRPAPTVPTGFTYRIPSAPKAPRIRQAPISTPKLGQDATPNSSPTNPTPIRQASSSTTKLYRAVTQKSSTSDPSPSSKGSTSTTKLDRSVPQSSSSVNATPVSQTSTSTPKLGQSVSQSLSTADATPARQALTSTPKLAQPAPQSSSTPNSSLPLDKSLPAAEPTASSSVPGTWDGVVRRAIGFAISRARVDDRIATDPKRQTPNSSGSSSQHTGAKTKVVDDGMIRGPNSTAQPSGSTTTVINGRTFKLPALPTPKPSVASSPSKVSVDSSVKKSTVPTSSQQKTISQTLGSSRKASSIATASAPPKPALQPPSSRINPIWNVPKAPPGSIQTKSKADTTAAPNGQARTSLPPPMPILPRPDDSRAAETTTSQTPPHRPVPEWITKKVNSWTATLPKRLLASPAPSPTIRKARTPSAITKPGSDAVASMSSAKPALPPTRPPTQAPQPPTQSPTQPPTQTHTRPLTRPQTQPPQPPTQSPTRPPTIPPTQPPAQLPARPPMISPTQPSTQPPTQTQTQTSPSQQRDGKRKAETTGDTPPRKRPVSILFPTKPQ